MKACPGWSCPAALPSRLCSGGEPTKAASLKFLVLRLGGSWGFLEILEYLANQSSLSKAVLRREI